MRRLLNWIWLLSGVWNSNEGLIHFNYVGQGRVEMMLNGSTRLQVMTLDAALRWARP